MALKTNREGRTGGVSEAIKGADALLAMSSSGPGGVSGKLIEKMSDWELFPREAAAVGAQAVKQRLARTRLTKKELYEKAVGMITHARKSTELLMRRGLIKSLPQTSRRRRR